MQVISSIQEEILQCFGKVQDSGQFYLTGGTALLFEDFVSFFDAWRKQIVQELDG